MKSNNFVDVMKIAYSHICIFLLGTIVSLEKNGLKYSGFLEIWFCKSFSSSRTQNIRFVSTNNIDFSVMLETICNSEILI